MLPSHVVSRLTRSVCSAGPRRAGRGVAHGERGAVLVHAAVAMLGLLAFSALTIDLGTLWVARAEAQNAVDAAALSGGIALAYVDPADHPSAIAAARAVAQAHRIWGEPIPAGSLTTSAGPCPAGAPSVTGDCLTVAVQRGGGTGTPLPVFFSSLFGVGSATLQASASAKVMLGNASRCPRPIAITDMWTDSHDTTGVIDGVWTADDIYDKYPDSGFATPPADADSYVAPSSSGPGSGMTITAMLGTRIFRERNLVWLANEPLHGGDFLTLDVPRPGGSGDFEQRYYENIVSCGGATMSLGQAYDVIAPHPHFTADGTQALIDLDPGAYWDGTAIRNSAFAVSPRLIEIAVFDPEEFASQSRPGPAVQATVRNLIGLFLENPGGAADLQGVIVPASGSFDGAAPAVTDQSTFLRSVALVR